MQPQSRHAEERITVHGELGVERSMCRWGLAAVRSVGLPRGLGG